MNEPVLLDTTLRDGEQSPGLYFTLDEKVYLAEQLDRLGVGIIEAGIPAMGKEEVELFRILERQRLKADILAWNRLNKDDVKASLQAGVTHVHLSVPTSTQLLAHKLRKEPAWIAGQMEEVIGFARREGLSVSLGAEDASRTEPSFLAEVFHRAQELGAVRVRYADTLGLLTPDRAQSLMKYLTAKLSIPIDFHGHNDFGLGTANALAAWKGGAQVISCSLLGLGERAGNTCLEELAASVHYLEGGFPGFDFPALRQVCETLSLLSGRPLGSHKPLFGSEIFKHESGIHVDGIIKDPLNYEFLPPQEMGGHRSLVVGKHSGRAALQFVAREHGYCLEEAQAEEFLALVRSRMAHQKGIDAGELFSSFLKTSVNPRKGNCHERAD